MGRTWKSAVLAVVVAVATMCSAHSQPVPFRVDADAGAVPKVSEMANRDDPRITDTDRSREALPPNAVPIVSYVAGLELLLAVMAAIACLLALAVAGVVARKVERPVSPVVPARIGSPESLILISAKKLLA
jgi:hypothetical protein